MRSRRLVRSALAVLALVGVAAAVTAAVPATATEYAPLGRPGPALSVGAGTLQAALHCSGDFGRPGLEPVLLSPATGVTPEQNYSWNYERAFTVQGRPWCAITMPYDAEGDIQVAGEYLVYAIRTESAMAGRRIAVVGHSQGGMSMRWALRFWPDTRTLVDDVIGMAGTNHGTTARSFCFEGRTSCPAASWQQAAAAMFIAALNSGAETFAGISYTEIFTHTDEVAQPNSSYTNSTSSLHTGDGLISNVAIQSICPLDLEEHFLLGTVDPVAYALVMDALNHAGPAVPARISRTVCSQLYQPGINPANVENYLQPLRGAPGLFAVDTPDINLAGIPVWPAEPPLRCYVFASGC